MVETQDDALRSALARAERAEAELARLQGRERAASSDDDTSEQPGRARVGHAVSDPTITGIAALREDSMMCHLLAALDEGKDIGHYGRLVFAMVARHFMSDDEVVAELTKDRDFSEEQAAGLLRQVESRDYNPPRRERIVEWQKEQGFPLLPNANDPECGNVYRSLHFPTTTYKHIEEYQEERAAAE
jgi:hypothetical protein